MQAAGQPQKRKNMKKYLKYLLVLLLFFPTPGCDMDDQLYQDAPDSSVLFPRDFLEQEIYKAPNMIDFPYNLYVYRSGIHNKSEASVNISVDEAELAAFNLEHETDYQLLPEAYYSYEQSVNIAGGEQRGISVVTIRADQIATELGFDDDFAIPFVITSATEAGTTEDNNKVILKINVKEPFVRQQSYGIESGSAVGTSNYTKALRVFVEFENEWDIALGYEVDYDLVDAYNAANETTYLPLPQANVVTFPSSFTLPAGTNSINVDLTLTTEGLDYFEPYMLPMRLVSSSEFDVDPSREIIYMLFTRDFDQNMAELIPLTIDMIDAWTQEQWEGPLENLIDGDTGTFWHSSWSAPQPLPHWIQINFEQETQLGGFNYTFRQPSGITDRPNHWDIQTSPDGENWTTHWTSKPNLPVEPVDAKQTIVFDQNYSARYFRIRILDTYGSRDWTHLSTIEVFTVKE